MSKRRFFLFVAFIAVSAFIVSYQAGRGPIRPLGFLATPLDYANQALTTATDFLSGVLGIGVSDKAEFARLREEVSRLKFEQQRLAELEAENRRLMGLLDLRVQEPRYLASAKVVGKGLDRWSNSYVIDKGSLRLIEEGMAVVTPEGLFGRVHEARPGFSTVLVVDDRQFSAAVRLQDSRTEAVLSGAGRGRCVLKYVTADQPVEEGEAIVTSGLDGLFPPGILVGYVSKVYEEADGFFHRIEVNPYVDPRKVEEVMVLDRWLGLSFQ